VKWYPVRITWADGERHEDATRAEDPADAVRRALLNWGSDRWPVVLVEVLGTSLP
jgi:hypothetical protein